MAYNLANENEWTYQRQLPADLPDWLRRQYRWIEDDGGNGRWTRTGLGDSQGRSVIPTDAQGRVSGEGHALDPAGVRMDDLLGSNVVDEANFDPSEGRARRSRREQIAMMVMAAAAGAGALGAAGGGAAAGTGAAEGAGLAGMEGLSAGGAGAGLTPASYAGLGGEFAAGATGAGAGVGGLADLAIPGNLSAEGIAAANPALTAAPTISAGNQGFLSTLGSALSGGGASAGDVASAAGTGISDYVTSNPVGALRTAGGLAAMGAGVSGGGGGGGGGGATGDLDSLLERQANANRYDWNTPTGSRSWAQGPDGRWTVNDALNPAEQANYENVRTLNADSTGYARDLLARTMAAPRRDYFADLPSTDSYFSRWRG